MLQSELVPGLPNKNGNYIVFDVITRKQWIAKIFTSIEGDLLVLSGQDHVVWDLAAFDSSRYRWVEILPILPNDIIACLTLVT